MRLKDFFSSIHDLLHQLFRLWALTSQSVEKQHKNSLSLANSKAVEKRMSLFASPSPQPPSAGPTLGKSNWKWGPKHRYNREPQTPLQWPWCRRTQGGIDGPNRQGSSRRISFFPGISRGDAQLWADTPMASTPFSQGSLLPAPDSLRGFRWME